MTQPNSVGRELVAQHRRKLFLRLKIYVVSLIVGGLIGLTISGFWSSLLKRCPECGQLRAVVKSHIQTIGPNGTVYYNCQPKMINQFSVPKPRQNTLVPPLDDR